MPTSRGVIAVLARQDGLITAAQAAQHGLPERTLRRWASDPGWERVAPRVFLAAGHPWTPRVQVRAAGLWVAGRGVVSGPAAAWWQQMYDRPPAEVQVTVPRRVGLRPYPGVIVRSRDVDVADLVTMDGMPLTDLPLTALETSIAVPRGSEFLDRALQKHVRFPRLYRAYCRNMGAYGTAAVSQLLTAAADRADSAAERLMIDLLREAGMTDWEHGMPFGRWTVDFAFPAAKVAVEFRWAATSCGHHGRQTLPSTWHDLTLRRAYVLEEIRAALRS